MSNGMKMVIVACAGAALNFASACLLAWVLLTPGQEVFLPMLAGFVLGACGSLAGFQARSLLA